MSAFSYGALRDFFLLTDSIVRIQEKIPLNPTEPRPTSYTSIDRGCRTIRRGDHTYAFAAPPLQDPVLCLFGSAAIPVPITRTAIHAVKIPYPSMMSQPVSYDATLALVRTRSSRRGIFHASDSQTGLLQLPHPYPAPSPHTRRRRPRPSYAASAVQEDVRRQRRRRGRI